MLVLILKRVVLNLDRRVDGRLLTAHVRFKGVQERRQLVVMLLTDLLDYDIFLYIGCASI